MSITSLKRSGLFLRSARADGTGISESSAMRSTFSYSLISEVLPSIASRTAALNLYGLAVEAMIVFVASPVDFL